MHQNASSVIFY